MPLSFYLQLTNDLFEVEEGLRLTMSTDETEENKQHQTDQQLQCINHRRFFDFDFLLPQFTFPSPCAMS
jgi:hypothetical protein